MNRKLDLHVVYITVSYRIFKEGKHLTRFIIWLYTTKIKLLEMIHVYCTTIFHIKTVFMNKKRSEEETKLK